MGGVAKEGRGLSLAVHIYRQGTHHYCHCNIPQKSLYYETIWHNIFDESLQYSSLSSL